jgi:hypothetical protein
VPIVLTNKVYIHMPKTGGTWVARCMQDDNGGVMLAHYGGHASVTEIPDHLLKGKKLFGTKRDPWSWYASWYALTRSQTPRAMTGSGTTAAAVWSSQTCLGEPRAHTTLHRSLG